MNRGWRSGASCFLFLILGVDLHAYEIELFDGVIVDSGFRWRLQSVDDDGRGDAIANTLKVRSSIAAELHSDWQFYGELDAVLAFNHENYNSGVFNPGTSPIPDPQGAEINQLFLQYNGVVNWQFKLGRQAISFDDERHIGRIEFWQNDQTYDAFSANYNNFQNLSFDYAYLDNAQRIFGNGAGRRLDVDDVRFAQNPVRPPAQLGEHQHNSHLFNLNYNYDRRLTVGAYAYLINNTDLTIASSNTWGVHLSGSIKPGNIKYQYELEWATQEGAKGNPWDYRANFHKIAATAQYRSHALTLAFEKLGTDDVAGFQTPLGTNHKFLGWADIFSGYRLTPGLQDHYITYKGRKSKLRWQIIFHRFKDASGDIDVGNELDLELAYRYTRKWEFKVISATYRVKSGFAGLPGSRQDLSSFYFSVNYNI